MDAGERETEKAYRRTKKRLTSIYTQAQTELERVLQEHTRKFEREDRVMRERMQKGEITPERYAEWQRLKVWQGEQWQHKLDNVTSVLANANTEALGIVNGQRLDVFEQNASFQQYRAAQAGISSAWNIYDSATVARLVEDDPQLLPPKKLDRTKDRAWNRRQVNNCITQGILQGESIPQIAKRIKEVTGSTNKAQMQRTARTAMTSAQNAGRQTAMEQQAAMGIRVQKMWIAAHDDRTRDAHGDLDGTKVDADKPFIATNRDGSTCELQYPGDPHGDPEQVYNCRCTLGYVYPDYAKEQNLGQFESFAEWREKHPKPERRRRGEESAAAEAGNPISRVKDTIRNHTGEWTVDELQDVGGTVSQHITEQIAVREADIDRQIRQARDDLYASFDRVDELTAQQVAAQRQGDTDLVRRIKDEKFRELERADQIQMRRSELEQQRKTVKTDVTHETLSGIREMGGITADNVGQYAQLGAYTEQAADTQEGLVTAMNRYPSSWLQQSQSNMLKLKPHWTTDRAYYNPDDGEIRITTSMDTNVHELGHRFEFAVPGIKEAEAAFYERRTRGCPRERLRDVTGRTSYREDEYTRRDKFLDPYMGKDYGGSAYELVSMGFEAVLVGGRYNLDADPEMKNWIFGLLAAL